MRPAVGERRNQAAWSLQVEAGLVVRAALRLAPAIGVSEEHAVGHLAEASSASGGVEDCPKALPDQPATLALVSVGLHWAPSGLQPDQQTHPRPQ